MYSVRRGVELAYKNISSDHARSLFRIVWGLDREGRFSSVVDFGNGELVQPLTNEVSNEGRSNPNGGSSAGIQSVDSNIEVEGQSSEVDDDRSACKCNCLGVRFNVKKKHDVQPTRAARAGRCKLMQIIFCLFTAHLTI